MLRKKEEKKEKVKEKAYYVKRLQEVCAQTKNHSFMDKGTEDREGTYKIWSSGSNDE